MKASVLRQFSAPPQIETIDDPTCPADGVVIEIRACGVCRTDHHGWSGHHPAVRLPHVMGHELAGVIVETGTDVSSFKIGDRVTAPFILGWGPALIALVETLQYARHRASSASPARGRSLNTSPSRKLISILCNYRKSFPLPQQQHSDAA